MVSRGEDLKVGWGGGFARPLSLHPCELLGSSQEPGLLGTTFPGCGDPDIPQDADPASTRQRCVLLAGSHSRHYLFSKLAPNPPNLFTSHLPACLVASISAFPARSAISILGTSPRVAPPGSRQAWLLPPGLPGCWSPDAASRWGSLFAFLFVVFIFPIFFLL